MKLGSVSDSGTPTEHKYQMDMGQDNSRDKVAARYERRCASGELQNDGEEI